MSAGRAVLISVTLTIGVLQAASSPAAGGDVTLTNKLATAASPYLREAARQPVAWYPWGDEPFRLARKLDRPILLDLGAIWCHWCHVMDEQTYSNPEIARLINEHFVAIKVDRDERPDIDARYQQAVQALSGQGGWPLTVFLSPEGDVFYGGGTFLPDDQYGRPGFRRLLPVLADIYRRQRDKVKAVGAEVSQALAAAEAAAQRREPLSSGLVDSIVTASVQDFDAVNGGFGHGVKFPMGGLLELALRRYAETADEGMLRIATTTLDAIAAGGIRDHVGGGFHRYATDPAWQVPHFEKLDYMNAQLLVAYLGAFQARREVRYREVAERTIEYVNRVLSDQQRGGFYAHQDADMRPGDDGGYYTWSVSEIRAVLPPEEATVIERYYGVTGPGNMPAAPGRTVLHVADTREAIAQVLGVPPSTVEALVTAGTARLREARAKRPTPYVDRTIYADRNAMMISAYLEAYKVLGRDDLKVFALKSLDFLLTHLRAKDGGLYHAFANSRAHVPGFLNDDVWVARALLEAFQVTGEPRYLAAARQQMDHALRAFWDPVGGSFFDLRPEPGAIGPLTRPRKSFADSDLPSPNAVAARVLDELSYLTNVPAYHQRARHLLSAFAGAAASSGRFAAGYALAVDLDLHPPAHAVIIGPRSDPRTGALWHAALAAFRPGKLVAAYDPAHVSPKDLPPAVAAAMANSQAVGEPQAYVCVGTNCSLPTKDPAAVSTLVSTFARAATPPGIRLR
jgi:uncharacterized protein